MGTNILVGLREQLREWKQPARMVWAMKDVFFGVEWARWLDRNLPGSRGVRQLPEANLFFPEEIPEIIAEEARMFWGSLNYFKVAHHRHVLMLQVVTVKDVPPTIVTKPHTDIGRFAGR